ncbi:MAG: glycerophosphodiester phosphodiesterase [Ignavibacteriales bacterium]
MNKSCKIFAHRGLSSKAPENTMSAFKKALDFDIDGIEFDVHLTKDNQIVVIHDEILGRTTNGTGFIKDYTYSDLSKFDAGGWFNHSYQGEKIPRLEEVIELLYKKDIIINIELKNSLIEYDGLEEKVLKIISEYGIKDKTIISSFNHYSIRRMRDLDKQIQTAILCAGISYNPGDYIKSIGANDVHSDICINSKYVNLLHENGFKIRCYTVNDVEVFKLLNEFGVDAVFTDKADVLLKYSEG